MAHGGSDKAVMYGETVQNGLSQLVPGGEARTALASDYAQMIEDGLLLEDAESFEVLIERCADIADRVNRSVK